MEIGIALPHMGGEASPDIITRVAGHAAARAFIERLVLKGKQPKTVDAYAKAVEDLPAYFARSNLSRVIEADEGDLDGYIADLKKRGPKKRGRGGMREDETKVRYLTGRKLSDNTIAQRVVACRLFYDFLIHKQLRSDPVNPIERGNDGRDGQRSTRGPVGKKKRLAWVPPDAVWEDLIRHIMLHEDQRTQAMILLAYDAALRREELVSLRVDDIDWALEVVKVRAETTKSGRERDVPVSTDVLHLVRAYIERNRRSLVAAYDGDDAGPLFLSESTLVRRRIGEGQLLHYPLHQFLLRQEAALPVVLFSLKSFPLLQGLWQSR